MPDREKVEHVINAFERVIEVFDGRISGPYFEAWVCATKDALALLKAQEARVMKVGEVRNWVNGDRVTREPVVIEMRGGVCAWIIDDEVRELPGEENLSSDLYGKTWRCWTSRPTEAEREATAWEMK